MEQIEESYRQYSLAYEENEELKKKLKICEKEKNELIKEK